MPADRQELYRRPTELRPCRRRARQSGLKVEMVIVDDDVALPDLPQARGLAGTLFVHKIAGALARMAAILQPSPLPPAKWRATAEHRHGAGHLHDSGIAQEDRIPPGMAELGLGIHGEAGVEQVAFIDADAAVAAVWRETVARDMAERPHVALINNLGGTSVLEMSVILNAVRRRSSPTRITHLVGPAAMMTSLDMHGFSISRLSGRRPKLRCCNSRRQALRGPGISRLAEVTVRVLPDGLTPLRPTPSGHKSDRGTGDPMLRGPDLRRGRSQRTRCEVRRRGYRQYPWPARPARSLKPCPRLPLADQGQLYRAIGLELSQTMGGSSGVLLAIFFAAAGDAASGGLPMREALKAGLGRMQEVGGARLGDRTMIDALTPALDGLDQGLPTAARAARAGADPPPP